MSAPARLPGSGTCFTDFEPVAPLSFSSLMIVGKNGAAGRRCQGIDRLAQGKSRQGVSRERRRRQRGAYVRLYFQEKTGTRFQFVPYRGGAPAMQDLVAGQIDLMCAEASQTLAHVRGGKMKAFAVCRRRAFRPPDVPTMEEVGVPGPEISSGTGCGRRRARPRRHREAQRCRCGGVRGCGGAQADCRAGPGNPAARAADAAGARGPPQGRDREMVADHQGGQHQAAMNRIAATGVHLAGCDVSRLIGLRCLRHVGTVESAAAQVTRRVRSLINPFPAGGQRTSSRGPWSST